MRRAGSDLKDLKSRRDYTGTILRYLCMCVCSESLMVELMNTHS